MSQEQAACLCSCLRVYWSQAPGKSSVHQQSCRDPVPGLIVLARAWLGLASAWTPQSLPVLAPAKASVACSRCRWAACRDRPAALTALRAQASAAATQHAGSGGGTVPSGGRAAGPGPPRGGAAVLAGRAGHARERAGAGAPPVPAGADRCGCLPAAAGSCTCAVLAHADEAPASGVLVCQGAVGPLRALLMQLVDAGLDEATKTSAAVPST